MQQHPHNTKQFYPVYLKEPFIYRFVRSWIWLACGYAANEFAFLSLIKTPLVELIKSALKVQGVA